MPKKKPKLDHSVNQTDMVILPREILCVIFSYLDGKSRLSASETCKFWFELIRNNSNLSSHIYLKCGGLKWLQTKIERSEWIWKRWPVLKVLELGSLFNEEYPKSIQEASDLVKSINFKDSSTLQKVIFSANFDFENFFPIVRSNMKMATVEQVIFNPKDFNESLEIEHVSVLHIIMNSKSNMPSMNPSKLLRFNQNMFEYLTDSMTLVGHPVQTLKLTLKCGTMLFYLSNIWDFVTDLYVKELTGDLLKNGGVNMLSWFQQLKRLRKCRVNVTLWSIEEWQYFEIQGPIIVNEKFQDMTEVNFSFHNCFDPVRPQGSDLMAPDISFEVLEVTKMPFEKSVSQLTQIEYV